MKSLHYYIALWIWSNLLLPLLLIWILLIFELSRALKIKLYMWSIHQDIFLDRAMILRVVNKVCILVLDFSISWSIRPFSSVFLLGLSQLASSIFKLVLHKVPVLHLKDWYRCFFKLTFLLRKLLRRFFSWTSFMLSFNLKMSASLYF